MPHEIFTHLADGNQYRFIDPKWSLGRTMYVRTHPEYVEPDWDSFEILVLDTSYEDEQVWRTLLGHEYENLHKNHWKEIFDKIRAWATV